jgi:hypothetical protein
MSSAEHYVLSAHQNASVIAAMDHTGGAVLKPMGRASTSVTILDRQEARETNRPLNVGDAALYMG